MKFGELYDGIGPDGAPFVNPKRFTLTELDECVRVADYLASAPIVLQTDACDVFVDEDGNELAIRVGYFSDGEFMWPIALAHLVLHYGLAPDAALYEHIRSNNYTVPTVNMELTMTGVHELLQERWAA